MNKYLTHSALALPVMLALNAANALADEASGTIRSVDAGSRTVVLRVDQQKTLELTVPPKAKILVDGKAASFEALRAGQKVTATFSSDVDVATQIKATTDAAIVDESALDLKWLEGEWILIAERGSDGKELTTAQLDTKKKRLSVVRSFYNATFSDLGKDEKVIPSGGGHLALNASTAPKQADLHGGGKTIQGIYSLDKDLDVFIYATGVSESARPPSIDAPGCRVEKYKRDLTIAAPVKAGDAGKVVLQLSSTDPRLRIAALRALGELGAAAKAQVPAIEKQMSDESSAAPRAAAYALTRILGPEESAKAIEKHIQGTTRPLRLAATTGLENCGSYALPLLSWAINDKDNGVRGRAVLAAAKADVNGTLYDRILPMLKGEPEGVLDSVRKYILMHGIRRFRRELGRWPKDFAEVHNFIRIGNPLIDLSPLEKTQPIPITPQPDGTIFLGPNGYFDGLENVYTKP